MEVVVCGVIKVNYIINHTNGRIVMKTVKRFMLTALICSLGAHYSPVMAQEDEMLTLTPAQEAACQRLVTALRERYMSLCERNGTPMHELLESALQEVADGNRADFDVVKQILGLRLEEAQIGLPAGTWILPVPINIILK